MNINYNYLNNLSLSQNGVFVPTEDSAKKAGRMWECVGACPDVKGCAVYQFRLKDAYDNSQWRNGGSITRERFAEVDRAVYQVYDALFPAIEPSYEQMAFLGAHQQETLQGLGFGYRKAASGVYVTLPSVDSLKWRWEALCRSRRDLPALSIVDSCGIAGDAAFVQAFQEHDLLVSDGAEFIHDMYAHVIPTLMGILEMGGGAYLAERARLRKLVDCISERILRARNLPSDAVSPEKRQILDCYIDHIQALQGALVDSMAASGKKSVKFTQKKIDNLVDTIYKKTSWQFYFRKRFPLSKVPRLREAYRIMMSCGISS